MELSTKIAQALRPKAPRARFWRVQGTSWAPLGRILGALGRLLDAVGHLLGASWPPLGRSWAPFGWSWLPLGCILPLREAPGWILEASGRVLGAILTVPGTIIRRFLGACELALTYAIKGCFGCCRKTLEVVTWAFCPHLQRGGTCAAHGIGASQVSAFDIKKLRRLPLWTLLS